MTNSENLTYSDCNWKGMFGNECDGAVEYRLAMSPTGINYPGCDACFEKRWESQEQTSARYGVPLTYYGNDDDGWNDDYSDY